MQNFQETAERLQRCKRFTTLYLEYPGESQGKTVIESCVTYIPRAGVSVEDSTVRLQFELFEDYHPWALKFVFRKAEGTNILVPSVAGLYAEEFGKHPIAIPITEYTGVAIGLREVRKAIRRNPELGGHEQFFLYAVNQYADKMREQRNKCRKIPTLKR